MILACHDVSKAFGEHVIIQNGSFHIEDHEKAALVGCGGIPVQRNMDICRIVGDHRPCHIIQLHIFLLPDHHHVIALCQQLILQFFCHGACQAADAER